MTQPLVPTENSYKSKSVNAIRRRHQKSSNYKTIADRLWPVSWHGNIHPTGAINRFIGKFPLPEKTVN